jgi:hypothetical protein
LLLVVSTITRQYVHSLPDDLVDHLHDEPRADGVGTVSNENTSMMYLSCLSSLDHERDIRSLLLRDEVMVYTSRSQSGRKSQSLGTDRSIRQHKDLDTGIDGIDTFLSDSVESVSVSWQTLGLRERHVDSDGWPIGMRLLEMLDGVHLLDRKDRRLEMESVKLIRLHFE